MLAIGQVLAQLKQRLAPSVTITDGASVKGSVRDAERIYGAMPGTISLRPPHCWFGKSGVTAANPIYTSASALF